MKYSQKKTVHLQTPVSGWCKFKSLFGVTKHVSTYPGTICSIIAIMNYFRTFRLHRIQWFLPSWHHDYRARGANSGDTFAEKLFRSRATFQSQNLAERILAGYSPGDCLTIEIPKIKRTIFGCFSVVYSENPLR